jgi:hypothetical protein
MEGDNVELLWYGLCVINAVVTLFVVSVVGLLCKQFLRCISRNRVKRRSAKHPMVHLLGIASREAAELDPGDIERRFG